MKVSNPPAWWSSLGTAWSSPLSWSPSFDLHLFSSQTFFFWKNLSHSIARGAKKKKKCGALLDPYTTCKVIFWSWASIQFYRSFFSLSHTIHFLACYVGAIPAAVVFFGSLCVCMRAEVKRFLIWHLWPKLYLKFINLLRDLDLSKILLQERYVRLSFFPLRQNTWKTL